MMHPLESNNPNWGRRHTNVEVHDKGERSQGRNLINGDYRGQNASVIKHNQSALGDKPAT